MELMLDMKIASSKKKIAYTDKILLIGSCFTEEIGNRMIELKFNVLQNPNGIIYDPLSISKSIASYIANRRYNNDEVFYMNELWQSWQHHSVFSGMNKEEVLQNINGAQNKANEFLKNAHWLIITL